MQTIDILRERTFYNARDILNKYNKCIIIRPTAFGKTGLLARFLSIYNNILYLYPNHIVKETAIKFYNMFNGTNYETSIPHVRFMSYNKLARMSDKEFDQYTDIDLIISDESHKLGAPKTKVNLQKLLDNAANSQFLGATATPERTDLIDVVNTFFENHVTFEYTLHDAFQDGILKKPHYCYCTYDTDADLKQIKMDAGFDDSNQVLNARLIEISKLYNVDKIIKDTCDKYAQDTNYMKFIVFFSDFKHIRNKGEDVVGWFKSAYPTHTVNTLTITSETKETTENINKLDSLVYKDKTIDLIFSCEMLNMGYHVGNITGIGMYRGTNANNVFVQQLGRALNETYAGIVFDWVQNIQRISMYQVLQKQSNKTKKKRSRYEALRKKLGYPDHKLSNDELLAALNDPNINITPEEIKEFKELQNNFIRNGEWWIHANDMEPEDLNATGHEAKYRELIRKTVAETKSMICRQIFAAWVDAGGDPSIMTRDYILSQKDPDGVPLSPYCYWKNQSVDAVLDEMGVV